MEPSGLYIRVSPSIFAELQRGPLTVKALLADDMLDDDRVLNLGAMWRAIDSALAGPAPSAPQGPFARIMRGGTALGKADVAGYGPARFVTPEEAVQIDLSLRDMGADAFLARLAPVRAEGDPAEEKILPAFLALQSFVHRAAVAGQCLLFAQV